MDTQNDSDTAGKDGNLLKGLAIVLGIAVGAAVLFLIAANEVDVLAAVGVGGLILLASFATGALFGFLFGVPRVLSREQSKTISTLTYERTQPSPVNIDSSNANDSTKNVLLRSNTNLERISDWLTTLLVGASLVQLYKVNDLFLGFNAYLSASARVFHPQSAEANAGVLPAIGPILLVFGTVCGFLFMYLNTRLVLIKLFYSVERLLSGGERLRGASRRSVEQVLRNDVVGSFVRDQIAKKPPTVDDALSLMFDLLYREDPDQVIVIGTGLQGTSAVQRAEYWFYLAAAFGQKLNKAIEADDSAGALDAGENALDCAARAIAKDPNFRTRIWLISDPSGTDNDLGGLRRDPRFASRFLHLVGRSQ